MRHSSSTGHQQLARVTATQRSYLRGFAHHLCRGDADADDLLQDALLAALTRGAELPSDSDLRAWLTTVMRHRHVDRCRRAATGRKLRLALAVQPPVAPEPEPWWAMLDTDAVRASLARLPPALAQPFALFALEHVPYKEIARRLGLPTATVGTRILRARARLRAAMTAPAVTRAVTA